VNDCVEIIYQDADLLALNKPAGLVCHPTKTDASSSLIGRVRLLLGPAAGAHMINRLDRETSGVVLVAKNSEVAGELGKIWEARAVEKIYLAIVHGHFGAETQVIDAPLGKDDASSVAIKDCVRADGLPSVTEISVQRRFHRAGRGFHFCASCRARGASIKLEFTSSTPGFRSWATNSMAATSNCISTLSKAGWRRNNGRDYSFPITRYMPPSCDLSGAGKREFFGRHPNRGSQNSRNHEATC
jgi:hypothetical protein